METLVNRVNSAMINNIQAEVDNLREEAKNRIGPREAARHYVNTHLGNMPVLVQGAYRIEYTDDRGNKQYKLQSRNDALWTIALQTTIEAGATSYAMLGSILTEWAEATLKVTWPKESALKTATIFVRAMQDLGILSQKVERVAYYDSNNQQQWAPQAKLDGRFSDEVLQPMIQELRDKAPMVCRPLRNAPADWINNEEGIGVGANMRLVRDSVIQTNAVDQRVLDAVNRLQNVPFKVPEVVMDAVYDMLDNSTDFNLSEELQRTLQALATLGNRSSFFPVTLDQRGRMYYRGGVVTPQGDDLCKAAFQFARAVPLGVNGKKHVYLQFANCMLKGAFSLEQRIQWVEDNLDMILGVKSHRDTFIAGKEPMQSLVAAVEIQKIHQWEAAGNSAETFMSTLVCHKDGTCNGLQHMAAITRDKRTAENVNCGASDISDTPRDLYMDIAIMAEEQLQSEEAIHVIRRFGRDIAKYPVMVTGYGAGEETILTYVEQYLTKHNVDTSLAEEIGKALISAIDLGAPAVRKLTTAIKMRMNTYLADSVTDGKIMWTTMDGFVAGTQYMDYEKNRVRAGKFNALIHNKENVSIDEVKTLGAMAPNFIHSLDATHLRCVVRAVDCEIVAIHDSIGSHAGDCDTVSEAIRQQFVELHNHDHMASLCEWLKVRKPLFVGDYNLEAALSSAYIFA